MIALCFQVLRVAQSQTIRSPSQDDAWLYTGWSTEPRSVLLLMLEGVTVKLSPGTETQLCTTPAAPHPGRTEIHRFREEMGFRAGRTRSEVGYLKAGGAVLRWQG